MSVALSDSLILLFWKLFSTHSEKDHGFYEESYVQKKKIWEIQKYISERVTGGVSMHPSSKIRKIRSSSSKSDRKSLI